MPDDNYIRNFLNIKDKNIIIDLDNIAVKKVKYVDNKFIYRKLSYTPDCCHVVTMLMRTILLLNKVPRCLILKCLMFVIFLLF